jgi:hypothetical protein
MVWLLHGLNFVLYYFVAVKTILHFCEGWMKSNACRFITHQQTAGVMRYKLHVL